VTNGGKPKPRSTGSPVQRFVVNGVSSLVLDAFSSFEQLQQVPLIGFPPGLSPAFDWFARRRSASVDPVWPRHR
jgi:hypothetical protein